MKRFFEEYGGIALAILVVLVLIAILSPVGGKIKGSLKEVTKGFDDKMKNGMNSSGIGFGGSSGGGGTKPEQTVNLITGQKITIAGKEYTVIENVQGTQYKVLANDVLPDETFNFNDKSNNYAALAIASYLDNDYYNGLDLKVRDAIVEQTIQQKVYSYYNETIIDWTGEVREVGTHKVFILSWDEVTNVYGTTKEKLKEYSNGSKYVWLRDAYKDTLMSGVGENGAFGINPSPYSKRYVRPAFVLDLSKVEYTTK